MGMLFSGELEGAWAGVKLMLRGAAGGSVGVETVRELIAAGQDVVRERDRERAAHAATKTAAAALLEALDEFPELSDVFAAEPLAALRACIGQQQPATVVPNPPLGHSWVTTVRDGVSGTPAGVLLCASCTGGKYGGANETQAPIVTATECLARHLAAGAHEQPAPAGESPLQAELRKQDWRRAMFVPLPAGGLAGPAIRIPAGEPDGHAWGAFIWGAFERSAAACRTCTERTGELVAPDVCASLGALRDQAREG